MKYICFQACFGLRSWKKRYNENVAQRGTFCTVWLRLQRSYHNTVAQFGQSQIRGEALHNARSFETACKNPPSEFVKKSFLQVFAVWEL